MFTKIASTTQTLLMCPWSQLQAEGSVMQYSL
jgi:hypothetical protein